MQLDELQDRIRADFARCVDPMPASQVLAHRLEQAGQLAQAVIRCQERDVEQELAEAHEGGVDLTQAVEQHLFARGADQIMRRLNG